jgi:hypothetical protein
MDLDVDEQQNALNSNGAARAKLAAIATAPIAAQAILILPDRSRVSWPLFANAKPQA